MNYVMVPVPEELRKQIMVFITQLTFHDTWVNWDPELLDEILGALDEDESALMDLLIMDYEQGTARTADQLARALGCTIERLSELRSSINERCDNHHKPPLVVEIPQVGVTIPEPGSEVLTASTSAAKLQLERKGEKARA